MTGAGAAALVHLHTRRVVPPSSIRSVVTREPPLFTFWSLRPLATSHRARTHGGTHPRADLYGDRARKFTSSHTTGCVERAPGMTMARSGAALPLLLVVVGACCARLAAAVHLSALGRTLIVEASPKAGQGVFLFPRALGDEF